ncbi:hypothetical protein ES703_74179 [subsurface metagenome]
MAKKTETKTEKIEKEYIIPLRIKWKKVPRYKRTNKAIKAIKEFLVRHMKIRDRDLKKVKIDKYLNEVVWSRGIKNPPFKIKVRAIKKGDIVKAELSEMPEKLKFKKLREEKKERKATEIGEKKKSMMEKAKEGMQKPEEKQTEEEKKEEKEKKSAVVESGKEMEKIAAKKTKHEAKAKTKQPKHQIRKALAK